MLYCILIVATEHCRCTLTHLPLWVHLSTPVRHLPTTHTHTHTHIYKRKSFRLINQQRYVGVSTCACDYMWIWPQYPHARESIIELPFFIKFNWGDPQTASWLWAHLNLIEVQTQRHRWLDGTWQCYERCFHTILPARFNLISLLGCEWICTGLHLKNNIAKVQSSHLSYMATWKYIKTMQYTGIINSIPLFS